MANTKHGWHIPGTSTDDVHNANARARCGGMKMCPHCKANAYDYLIENNIPIQKKSLPVEKDFDLEKELTALGLVKAYILDRLDKSDPVPEFKVYIVMSAYILGRWKMEISSSLPDGMYYEVTFNSGAEEIYVDAYKKVENIRVEC